MSEPSRLDAFLELSCRLTGFSVFELRGTGQAEAYLASLLEVVGEAVTDELLATYSTNVSGEEDPESRERLLRIEILGDEKLGPIARNVIKMWYVGSWYQLPEEWRESFGARERDTTFVVSSAAYIEGLLWPAIGANPPGAKGPGYGTWSAPPRIPEI